MPISKATNLACPLDGLPLTHNAKQVVCPRGHNFDVAKQGYINLLPVQYKHSKHPGDNEAMVEARTAVLNSGVYAPIAAKLNAITFGLIASRQNKKICLLDAGCGEGYYLAQLLAALQQQSIDTEITLIGLDISKPAILAAAKRSKQITWLIATSKVPPLLPGSVDFILCLFGFPMYDSFRQLLSPAGKLILVEAGPEHLIEIRNIIYPTVTKAPPPELCTAMAAGFSLSEQTQLNYRMTLETNTQIMNLLYMTPHFFRATQAGKQAASHLEAIDITVDVLFRVLEHRPV